MEVDIVAQIAAAHAGSRAALGSLLEAYRPFLHMLAEKDLPLDLRAKAGISDLVQETYAEAFNDFGQFRGRSEAELAGWLEQILRHNIASFVHRYRGTDKRRVEREISLDAAERSGAEGGCSSRRPWKLPAARSCARKQPRPWSARWRVYRRTINV